MKNDKAFRSRNALQLEDFDIIELVNKFPNQKIGVNVNRIYIQIAKYNGNPERDVEIQILKNTLYSASNKKHFDSRYVMMTLHDVVKCFGKCLKYLPNSTFVLTHVWNSK